MCNKYIIQSLNIFIFSESKQSSLALLKTCVAKSKQETQRLAIEHRELHSTVSKVGKAIDRVCII